ncbi:MAG TPA: DUF4293 domain-containing protein [Cytophagaceae bacterium]|nr:DUF4293 domain-containing protein [Cytophagaceae bacterium]
MIQRIQSVLLAGVVILLTINLFVPIWSISQTEISIVLDAFSIKSGLATPDGTILPVVKSNIYIGGLILVCIVLAIFVIFQYKNRALQIRLCSLLTLFTLGIIGTYFIAIPAAKSLLAIPADGNYGIGYFLPIAASILTIAARHFIRKDDNLVKSVDRLR